MSTSHGTGRGIFIKALQDNLGYTERKAGRIANAFLKCMANCLGRGEKIIIPGWGILETVTRKQSRIKRHQLKGGWSIITNNKQIKSVRALMEKKR